MSNPNAAPEPNHSRAFERLVEAKDDVVGLLAYVLYKRTINERRSQGVGVAAPSDRDPRATEIELYRDQALDYLTAFASEIVSSERAGIIEQALGDHQSALALEIRRATGFWWSVLTGVVAWIISILLTIFVVYAAPDWVTAFVHHLASR